jgi:sulfatase modifying factor 1
MRNLYFLFVVIVLVYFSKDKESTTLENINYPSFSIPKDVSFGVETLMGSVKGGNYIPLYGSKNKVVKVTDFLIDVYPVSNANYQAFVKQNKRWRKSEIKKLFADDNYLNNWKNDTLLAVDMKPNSPVTNISWYAANAYCECQGKRLATVDEWEFAAMANQEVPDARKIKSYNQSILDWYEKPKTFNNEIGKTFKNYYGVYDLHGLVWEWTSDFNSILLTGESRSDVTTDKNLFCGSGSLNASDLMNYAAFIRYAFRGSIKADYAVKNLGFRCVKDTLNIKKP